MPRGEYTEQLRVHRLAACSRTRADVASGCSPRRGPDPGEVKAAVDMAQNLVDEVIADLKALEKDCVNDSPA